MLENWLDTIFDMKATLVNETWLEKVTSKQGNYIFDSATLRTKIFQQHGGHKLRQFFQQQKMFLGQHAP